MDFLNGNQGLIIFFELLISIITAGVFIWILIVTKRYAKSTKDMANEMRNSVAVSADSIDASWDLRIEKSTFDLIKDWYRIKMEIACEEEAVVSSFRGLNKGNCLEIINYCVKALEYFNMVNGYYQSNRIKKNLFFKNMKEEIVFFKNIRLKKIKQDYNDAKNKLLQIGMDENEFINFNDKGLSEIYKIAKEWKD